MYCIYVLYLYIYILCMVQLFSDFHPNTLSFYNFSNLIRSVSMKQGYLGELDARESEFTSLKLKLEGLYMIGKDDKEIENDEKTKGDFERALQEVETLAPTYASTIKSVKMAIESWNQKPIYIYIYISILLLYVHYIIYNIYYI